jgi:hypothetical protein
MTNRYPLPLMPSLHPDNHGLLTEAVKAEAFISPNTYLAGPMRGYNMHNFPAFLEAALLLRRHGWGVENPAEYDIAAGVDPSKDEADWPITVPEMLRTDFRLILEQCNAIVLLPGWINSKGATMELAIAQNIGLPAFELFRVGGGGKWDLKRIYIEEVSVTFEITRPRLKHVSVVDGETTETEVEL